MPGTRNDICVTKYTMDKYKTTNSVFMTLYHYIGDYVYSSANSSKNKLKFVRW